MTTKTVAFFNNKGGVGKTSLVYHVAWMYAELGVPVVAVDLDPQANLTASFLDEDKLEEIWSDSNERKTIYGSLSPLVKGTGDVADPHIEDIDDYLGLVPGDLTLSLFEDQLSENWPKCGDGDERAFRVISAFWRIIQKAAEERDARIILMDLGPNLGAINRAALIAANYVVAPLAPDIYSLQGLKNLGPTLRDWKGQWRDRKERTRDLDFSIPPGDLKPIGYIIMQHSERLNRPTKAYAKWAGRIPALYRDKVLEQDIRNMDVPAPANDPYCLAMLKHYRTLMPIAHEAQKPIFKLKPGDGVVGNHISTVRDSYMHFKQLTEKISEKIGEPMPSTF